MLYVVWLVGSRCLDISPVRIKAEEGAVDLLSVDDMRIGAVSPLRMMLMVIFIFMVVVMGVIILTWWTSIIRDAFKWASRDATVQTTSLLPTIIRIIPLDDAHIKEDACKGNSLVEWFLRDIAILAVNPASTPYAFLALIEQGQLTDVFIPGTSRDQSPITKEDIDEFWEGISRAAPRVGHTRLDQKFTINGLANLVQDQLFFIPNPITDRPSRAIQDEGVGVEGTGPAGCNRDEVGEGEGVLRPVRCTAPRVTAVQGKHSVIGEDETETPPSHRVNSCHRCVPVERVLVGIDDFGGVAAVQAARKPES